MQTAIEYLARTHPRFSRKYRAEDGGAESCTGVAMEIAELLIKEGRMPALFAARGRFVGTNRAAVRPRALPGTSWGAHIVCYDDGLVYDPMVADRPVPAQHYAATAFSEAVDFRPAMTYDELCERIPF